MGREATYGFSDNPDTLEGDITDADASRGEGCFPALCNWVWPIGELRASPWRAVRPDLSPHRCRKARLGCPAADSARSISRTWSSVPSVRCLFIYTRLSYTHGSGETSRRVRSLLRVILLRGRRECQAKPSQAGNSSRQGGRVTTPRLAARKGASPRRTARGSYPRT